MAGYLANRNRAMISVEQGKQRIFGFSESLDAQGRGYDSETQRKEGKKVHMRPSVNNII
jgi:hypothetical protein